MLECLILGDSIAVGTSLQRPECVSYAVGGYNTKQWNKKFRTEDLSAGSVIISLGTNDHDGVNSFKELLSMRQRVDADRVYWIMPPIKPHIQDMVRIIAKNFNDTIITIPALSKDNIHPSTKGYKQIAEVTKSVKQGETK